MDETIEAFETRYRQLAVVTCEWRAFGVADPEDLASRVFTQMRMRRRPPTLAAFYKAVEEVVAVAYREASAQNSFLEGMLRGQLRGFGKRQEKTDDELARAALSGLRAREVNWLRQAFWDELTPDEMAEVNGGTPEAQTKRVDETLCRFGARLPEHLADDPRAAMIQIHPGEHRRH